MSSIGSEAGNEANNVGKCGETVKMGYLKKLKVIVYFPYVMPVFSKVTFFSIHSHANLFQTMKKKYFVLRADSATSTACLEYYDSGKKWKNNHPPKRCVYFFKCLRLATVLSVI